MVREPISGTMQFGRLGFDFAIAAGRGLAAKYVVQDRSESCTNLGLSSTTFQQVQALTGSAKSAKSLKINKEVVWGRWLTVGCPVVVSPLPREWSCLYRRGEAA